MQFRDEFLFTVFRHELGGAYVLSAKGTEDLVTDILSYLWEVLARRPSIFLPVCCDHIASAIGRQYTASAENL